MSIAMSLKKTSVFALALLLAAGCDSDTKRMLMLAPPRMPRPVLFVHGETVEVEYGPYQGRRGVVLLHGESCTEPDYWVETRNSDGKLDVVQVHQSDLAGGDTDYAKRCLRR